MDWNRLAQIAYEAYRHEIHYRNPSLLPWASLDSFERDVWFEVAKHVACDVGDHVVENFKSLIIRGAG